MGPPFWIYLWHNYLAWPRGYSVYQASLSYGPIRPYDPFRKSNIPNFFRAKEEEYREEDINPPLQLTKRDLPHCPCCKLATWDGENFKEAIPRYDLNHVKQLKIHRTCSSVNRNRSNLFKNIQESVPYPDGLTCNFLQIHWNLVQTSAIWIVQSSSSSL